VRRDVHGAIDGLVVRQKGEICLQSRQRAQNLVLLRSTRTTPVFCTRCAIDELIAASQVATKELERSRPRSWPHLIRYLESSE